MFWTIPAPAAASACASVEVRLPQGAVDDGDAGDPGNGDRRRGPLFAPLPVDGVWTSVGLSRGQFFLILVASSLLFLLWGEPLWKDPRGAHLGRLVASYAFIPVACAAALAWNRKLTIPTLSAASAVIALLKLLVTAGLDLVIGTVVAPR